mgnify:CR=1 FL=1
MKVRASVALMLVGLVGMVLGLLFSGVLALAVFLASLALYVGGRLMLRSERRCQQARLAAQQKGREFWNLPENKDLDESGMTKAETEACLRKR